MWYSSALLAGFHERYPNGLVAGIPVQHKKIKKWPMLSFFLFGSQIQPVLK